MQHLGQEPSLGQDRPSPSGAGSPYMDLGEVTNLCLATSSATVDGDLPSSRAIALQPMPRSSILSIALRSCLSSLEYDLGGPPLPFLAILSSVLRGPALPARQ